MSWKSVLTSLTVVVSLILASSAAADPKPDPTLTATAEGSTVTVSGCGYDLGRTAPPVTLEIVAPSGATETLGLGLFANGCFPQLTFDAAEAGTYTLNAYQTRGNHLRLEASTTVVV